MFGLKNKKKKQALKPWSYASSKLWLTDLQTNPVSELMQ